MGGNMNKSFSLISYLPLLIVFILKKIVLPPKSQTTVGSLTVIQKKLKWTVRERQYVNIRWFSFLLRDEQLYLQC